MGRTIRLRNDQEEALCLLDEDPKKAIDVLLNDRDIYSLLEDFKERLKTIEKKVIKMESKVNEV